MFAIGLWPLIFLAAQLSPLLLAYLTSCATLWLSHLVVLSFVNCFLRGGSLSSARKLVYWQRSDVEIGDITYVFWQISCTYHNSLLKRISYVI